MAVVQMGGKAARAQGPSSQVETTANETSMSSSKRHQETKGQFRIKIYLIKWLRIKVSIGLCKLYLGVTADIGEQLHGSGTETQLNSFCPRL